MKMISVPVLKAGVIAACIVGLVGCGGGGGGGAGGGAAAVPVVIAPFKGKFSAGATVTFKRLDGTVLWTGTTIADGTATAPASVSGYTGPVLVEVSGATYYDEVSESYVPFTGAPLRALVPALSDGARIAVTLATNAAVAMVEAGNGGLINNNVNANQIVLANTKVAVALGLGSGADILQASTLIDGSTNNLSVSVMSDRYALQLAAFALSPSSGASALDAARDIAKDLSDGIFDGLYSVGGVPTAIGGGYIAPTSANMQAHIQAAANQYATAESRGLINAAPGNWVQVVADVTTGVTPPATGTAAYLAQAKGMFAELRSIFSFYSDSADSGFLNVQRQRITNDLTNTVAPSLGLTADRVVLMANGMQMAVDVTGSVVSAAIAGLPAPVYLTQNNLQLRQDGSGNYYFWRQVGASNGDDTVSCASNAFSQSAWTAAASSGAVPAGFHVQCDGSAATGVVGGANLARFHTIIEKTGNTSFNYKAWRTLVATETVDGRSGTAPNYTYAYTGTVAAQFGNINNPDSLVLALINGSLPRSQEGAARDSLSANVELSQSGNVNTLTITGSLQSLNGSGTALSTFTLAQGTQVLGAVDSGLVTSVAFVGEARTANTKFNGTLTLGSFLMDASETYLMPTSIAFNGSITDTSSGGGTTPFLSGTLGLTVGNQSNFDATQPNSQSNFRTFTATFNGNVTVPAHPVATLVFNGSQHTGTNLTSATLAFTRANINITGSVSQDGSGTQTLSLTNQDGIQVAEKPSGSGYVVTKSGVELATITNDGVIIYMDGTGGSL